MNISSVIALLSSIDWATLSNISVIVTAIFVVYQLREMRLTTQAQSYGVARQILQDERVRKARRTIFRIGKVGKPLEKWTREEIEDAEIVCHTYDTIGQMVRYKLLWKSIIIQSWGPSLRNSWPIVSPLIMKYRDETDAPEYWDDYEWLSKEAFEYKKRKERKVGKLLGRWKNFIPGFRKKVEH